MMFILSWTRGDGESGFLSVPVVFLLLSFSYSLPEGQEKSHFPRPPGSLSPKEKPFTEFLSVKGVIYAVPPFLIAYHSGLSLRVPFCNGNESWRFTHGLYRFQPSGSEATFHDSVPNLLSACEDLSGGFPHVLLFVITFSLFPCYLW